MCTRRAPHCSYRPLWRYGVSFHGGRIGAYTRRSAAARDRMYSILVISEQFHEHLRHLSTTAVLVLKGTYVARPSQVFSVDIFSSAFVLLILLD